MTMTKTQFDTLREQIQEDILGWTDINHLTSQQETEICQIVVDNFKKLGVKSKPQTILKVQAKCSDLCNIQLIPGLDGKSFAEYDGYVPGWFPNPTQDHYGDYVELSIDIATGQILNWKRPSLGQLKETFGDKS